MYRHAVGWRTGQPSGIAHEASGEARGSLWRQISHNRFPAVQLYEFEHRHRRRADAVSAAGTEPLHRHRRAVGSGSEQRRRIRAAALHEGDQQRMVSRHGERDLPEHELHRTIRSGIRADSVRRSHLQDGLQQDAGIAHSQRRGSDHRRSSGSDGNCAQLRHYEHR